MRWPWQGTGHTASKMDSEEEDQSLMYEYSPVSPETAAMAGQDTADQSFAATDHISPPHGLQSTPKIAPGFDGRISWFTYEEAIDDWLDIATLLDEKPDSSLRNRGTVRGSRILSVVLLTLRPCGYLTL